jgi:hypothetical protein
MKISEMLASNWLRKEDLSDPVGGEVFTIKKLTEELVGQDQQSKWACHWRERDVAPMLLNKTNLRILAAMLGDDTDGWIGKEVEVYHDPSISYAGQLVGGLRVRPPRPPKPRARQARQEIEDDPIPF